MHAFHLLTERARQTRFDFEWTVQGCIPAHLGQQICESYLRRALTEALSEHGVLSEYKSNHYPKALHAWQTEKCAVCGHTDASHDLRCGALDAAGDVCDCAWFTLGKKR